MSLPKENNTRLTDGICKINNDNGAACGDDPSFLFVLVLVIVRPGLRFFLEPLGFILYNYGCCTFCE